MEGAPINRMAEWLTTSSVSVVSLKTLYRWKLRIMSFWGKWWIDQRKRWVIEYQEGDGLLSLYREGIKSNEELQILLSFYFGGIDSVPWKGRLFSKISLRQAFSISEANRNVG